MLRIDLDLAAYARNANIDRAVEGFPLTVARKRQGWSRLGPGLVVEEDLEQIELHTGQWYLALVGGEQLMRSEIENARAHPYA